MQRQIDPLESDLDVEREFTLKVCNEKKELEGKVNALIEEAKKEVSGNDYFHRNGKDDVEEKKVKHEQLKLLRRTEIADDVIKKLKKEIALQLW